MHDENPRHPARQPLDRIFNAEDQQMFERLRASYWRRFDPQDDVESTMLDEIVVLFWQMRRLRAYEDANIELEAVNHQRNNGVPNDGVPLVMAHRALADNSNVFN